VNVIDIEPRVTVNMGCLESGSPETGQAGKPASPEKEGYSLTIDACVKSYSLIFESIVLFSIVLFPRIYFERS
jgi:hypothetical protein